MTSYKYLLLFLVFFLTITLSEAQINDKSINLAEGQLLSLITEKGSSRIELTTRNNELFFSTICVTKKKENKDNNITTVSNNTLRNPVTKSPYETFDIYNVLVNNENGFIKKGDILMVSSTPGIAMKAKISGIMIGIALENQPQKEKTVLIKCRLMVQYVKM